MSIFECHACSNIVNTKDTPPGVPATLSVFCADCRAKRMPVPTIGQRYDARYANHTRPLVHVEKKP